MVRPVALLALMVGAALTPPAIAPAIAAPWQVERSDVLTIASADGHRHKVMVAWPEGPPPPAGWPVLWLLDGEDNFATAVMNARRLARAGDRSGIEPGLIVALESGSLARRVLDYTPPAPGYSIPAQAPASGMATGGGDAFLDFVDHAVRPKIAARWKIDAGRQTLMGHSLGGLLALHALARGEYWTSYVAVSPSMWFGDGLIQREIGGMAPAPGKRLIAARGDAEGGPADGKGQVEELAPLLTAHGVTAHFKILPGQNHGATMMAMMNEGIAVAFGRQAP